MNFEQFVFNLTKEQTALIKSYERTKHESGFLNFCSQNDAMSEMEKYGYPYDLTERMLPVDLNVALKLFQEDCEIFLLFPGGMKKAVQEENAIIAHNNKGGQLGVTESCIEQELRLSENYFLGEVL